MRGGALTEVATLPTEQDVYEVHGLQYRAAWEKMAAACPRDKTPPSFEVFSHELRLANEGIRRISPMQLADAIVSRW
jgi:hypothetical protein